LEESAASSSNPPEGGSPLRILIVDDLTDAADSLARLLRLLGHEARAAYSGPAALSAAQQFLPHAILLDIGLPALDGYQVAGMLRQIPALQSACLIALSGHGGEVFRERARQAGFDEYLLKPINTEQLELLLSELAAGRCSLPVA
jgi:two-component system CheB/CheR fusion protein